MAFLPLFAGGERFFEEDGILADLIARDEDGEDFDNGDGEANPSGFFWLVMKLKVAHAATEAEESKSNVPLRRDKVRVDRGHTGDVEGNEPHRCCMEAGTLSTSCDKNRGRKGKGR